MTTLQEQVDALALSVSIMTIGLYAAGCAEDDETMREQMKDVAVHAQAVLPEPMFSLLMEKIGVHPFQKRVDEERVEYLKVMGQ